jgi:hypothetical protein
MSLPPDMVTGKIVEPVLDKGHFGIIVIGYLAFLAFLRNDTGLWPFH